MDKRARDAAKKIRDGRPAPKKAKPVKSAEAEKDAPVAAQGDDRAALIEQTMALYRQRHEEYEQLDEDVRERLTKLAGDKLSGKDS